MVLSMGFSNTTLFSSFTFNITIIFNVVLLVDVIFICDINQILLVNYYLFAVFFRLWLHYCFGNLWCLVNNFWLHFFNLDWIWVACLF